jgi:NTE family protein
VTRRSDHVDLVRQARTAGTSQRHGAEPCPSPLRPTEPAPVPDGPTIGLTFSGGGFRATFSALGVIRLLSDAGLLGDVRYVSSVSGGSLANAMLATTWPVLRAQAFSNDSVDTAVIGPLRERVVSASLKNELLVNIWRTIGKRNRTDLLAWAFDKWWFDGAELEGLDAQCRWIFNAGNLATGVRFGFERDVVGDYVTGLAPTAGSGLRVAQAVAASAAVPGAFAEMKIDEVTFPCTESGPPLLLDGGTYDNTGLEALDHDQYGEVLTISINSGGIFVPGKFGGLPIIKDLQRANSMLYRQSTALRTRWMIERFEAYESANDPTSRPVGARRGVLFGLATTVGLSGRQVMSDRHREFVETFPERRTHGGTDLSLMPTVFDKLEPGLVDALVYRGWWLTGALLAQCYPDLMAPVSSLVPPPIPPPD